jgi:lipoprotein NlpI
MASRSVPAISLALTVLAPHTTASAGQTPASVPQVVFERAVSDFVNGRIAESVAGFDEVVQLAPRSAAGLWQRGIALYYAGRYQDCRAQFEAHRTVNPNDVENAAWHFICVARAETPAAARAALLPVGPDARVPMRQIYDLYRGALAQQAVLAAANGEPAAEFYAHLYVGLYLEATGDRDGALEHIAAAAADRYGTVGGYMHAVALVHLGILRQG